MIKEINSSKAQQKNLNIHKVKTGRGASRNRQNAQFFVRKFNTFLGN